MVSNENIQQKITEHFLLEIRRVQQAEKKLEEKIPDETFKNLFHYGVRLACDRTTIMIHLKKMIFNLQKRNFRLNLAKCSKR